MYICQCSNQVLNSKDEHQPHFPVHRRKKKKNIYPTDFPTTLTADASRSLFCFLKLTVMIPNLRNLILVTYHFEKC